MALTEETSVLRSRSMALTATAKVAIAKVILIVKFSCFGN